MNLIKVSKNIIDNVEYKFLQNYTNRIVLLTYSGSYAYGLNNEDSDIDIRGVVLENKNHYIGLSKFEQFESRETDTVLYGVQKFIKLLIQNNPNIIELLGVSDDSIIQYSPIYSLLKENVNLFLSKRIARTFGGYATSQLRRLQNSLARDEYSQAEKENHICNSIKNQFNHFKDEYSKISEGGLNIYIDTSSKNDIEKEIFIDMNIKHYPLRDLKNMWSDMHNVIKTYGVLNHRNNKKDEKHLRKHAMHLVRLLTMANEILKTGKINTNRTQFDSNFLMKIRNGDYSYNEIFTIVDKLEDDLSTNEILSVLPKHPNLDKIEKLQIQIYEEYISKQ